MSGGRIRAFEDTVVQTALVDMQCLPLPVLIIAETVFMFLVDIVLTELFGYICNSYISMI